MTKNITIKDLIIKALNNEENRNEDGSVNWCWVDADIHMDNDEMKLGFTNDELFEELESFDVDADIHPEERDKFLKAVQGIIQEEDK